MRCSKDLAQRGTESFLDDDLGFEMEIICWDAPALRRAFPTSLNGFVGPPCSGISPEFNQGSYGRFERCDSNLLANLLLF